MPELAAIYGLGLVACLALMGVFVSLSLRRRSSPAYRTLLSNLRRAGLYWSENLDRIVPWTDGCDEQDRTTTIRNITLTGSLLSLLSWAGVFFLLIIMVSYRFLARSRLEKSLFVSDLAKNATMRENEVRVALEPIAREFRH